MASQRDRNPLETMNSADFDIRRFGAVPDGDTLNTAAIQEAIDACHEHGGRVVCGPGTWLTGSLELKSRVTLHLEPGCRIVGSERLEDYARLRAKGFHADAAPEKSAHALLWAAEAEEIAITGSGLIDGRGSAFYRDPDGKSKLEKPDTPRPRIGMFYRCRNLRLEDVSLHNCACWTLWLMQCENVRVRGLEIRGNRRLRNIDGIDVDACRNVIISDCVMDTEDDCIAVRAIRALYAEPAVCENLTVTNCVLKSGCQGVRVGCPSDGVIRNCAFSNLVIESGSNGILFENPRRYLHPGVNGADIADIVFANCVVRSRRAGIKVLVEEGIALQQLARLIFADLRIHCGEPCLIQGCAETIIRDIRLRNVKIEAAAADGLLCRHCECVSLSDVDVSTDVSV